MKKIRKIGFVGAGRVAGCLSHALSDAGYTISWVWSRTEAHALHLALDFGAMHTSEYRNDLPETDLVIISVSDDEVMNVIHHLDKCSSLVVHTCGSLPMDLLSSCSSNYGVLYPVQTFTSGRKVNLREVPLCIEASDNRQMMLLNEVASSISDHVQEMDSQQRLCLHIAAVFANNFSNYMYTLAGNILDTCGLPATLIHPLMRETTAKAIEISAKKVQTGPAARADIETIRVHLEWLKNEKSLQDVYLLLSKQLAGNPEIELNVSE
jgi:predicted short-subunit dehydrogenase-like oxidoreductase (DUF2520 family)